MRAARHLAHAGAPPAAQQAALIGILRADPTLMALLLALRPLALPQWRLVSGAVYQSVWNALTGRAPGHGIKDYDVCSFDGDVSYEAEDRIIRQVAAATRPLVRLSQAAVEMGWALVAKRAARTSLETSPL